MLSNVESQCDLRMKASNARPGRATCACDALTHRASGPRELCYPQGATASLIRASSRHAYKRLDGTSST